MERKKLKTNQKNIIKKKPEKPYNKVQDKELIKLYTSHNEAP